MSLLIFRRTYHIRTQKGRDILLATKELSAALGRIQTEDTTEDPEALRE